MQEFFLAPHLTMSAPLAPLAISSIHDVAGIHAAIAAKLNVVVARCAFGMVQHQGILGAVLLTTLLLIQLSASAPTSNPEEIAKSAFCAPNRFGLR